MAGSTHPEVSEGLQLLKSASYAIGVAPDPVGAGGVQFQNDGARFLDVIIDITDKGAAGTVTVEVDAQDPASKKWYQLLTSATYAANGTNLLHLGVGLTPAANVTAAVPLPKILRVVPTVAVNAVTFSVGVNLCP